MSAPSQGLPAPLLVHVVDAQGNDIPVDSLPSVAVGGKGKTTLTFLRFELWSRMEQGMYWQGELHLFMRA